MRRVVRPGSCERWPIDYDGNAFFDVAERAVRTIRLLYALQWGAALSKSGRKWEHGLVHGDAEPRNRYLAEYARAAAVCRRYLPSGFQLPGIMQQLTQADEVDYLKAAACIRVHGFPSVPDPTFSGGSVHINVPGGIDKNSPGFLRAVATCRRLIPAGLPYSS